MLKVYITFKIVRGLQARPFQDLSFRDIYVHVTSSDVDEQSPGLE